MNMKERTIVAIAYVLYVIIMFTFCYLMWGVI